MIEVARDLSSNQCLQLAVALVRGGDRAVFVDGALIVGDIDAIVDKSCIMEVVYLPGINDNTANVVGEVTVSLLGIDDIKVMTSSLYAFDDDFGHNPDKQELVIKSICNPIVQRVVVESGRDFGYRVKEPFSFARPSHEPSIIDVDLDVDDEALMRIARLGIESNGKRRGALNLGLEDMRSIGLYFRQIGRKPNDIEIEALAQSWSEHCKHRIFNAPIDEIEEGLFCRYISGATFKIMAAKPGFCVSVFSDNAGAIVFDDEYLVTHKVETHNSPSALDPYGGAMTGILGVNRDCLGFGMAAKPIANTYAFCFARNSGESLYRDKECTKPILDAEKIINDVVSGIESGGNCSGIPTPHGIIRYDDCYRGKPLVYAGTIGLIPRKVNGLLSHKTAAKNGDLIVMLGNRVGRDGIHGATLSSGACDERSDISMVQIGNAYLQKKLTDAVLEMRGLFSAITDNGAGGLSSSVGEMGGRGFVVDIEHVPTKNSDMDPWEIWISESQERMTMAVALGDIDMVQNIARDHDVECSVIGEFNESGMAVVRYAGKNIMEIPTDFLANGYHKERLNSEKVARSAHAHDMRDDVRAEDVVRRDGASESDIASDILSLLASCNLCSRAMVVRRYDHEVQGTSVLKPIIGDVCSEASVIRPVLSSDRALAVSSGLSPIFWHDAADYCDTYNLAACSIDTVVRNLVSVGANTDKIALLDNFCWRDPYNPMSLWQLRRAAEACYDYAVAYGAPFISGKDSMFNDFVGHSKQRGQVTISIKPTLLISGMAIVDDLSHVVSMDFKSCGDAIYVVGATKDEVCGCSEYARVKELYDTRSPGVDAAVAFACYRKLFRTVRAGLLSSAVPLNAGGLAVGIARSALSGDLGCEVDLGCVPCAGAVPDSAILFSETQSRMLVSVRADDEEEFCQVMAGVVFGKIGTVCPGHVLIRRLDGGSVALSLAELSAAYCTENTGIV